MLSYIIALFALPALFVAWFFLQDWLKKSDAGYKGYKAGCSGCSRSCGDNKVSLLSKKNLTDKS
ncbi:MAG: hypothetical protein KZQ83_16555 [gamma proteobacterium symbiont of Taylorina sp.]|nr:hypothetical protein [gamma proteobacterium symbiont of Taylorina sp.]